MVSAAPIRHLTATQVDPRQWDRCITGAVNNSPYARYEYLNALCPGWEALVMGDYEWVMPLPIKKKFGIRYLYQPFLVPYTGVFGKELNPVILESFLRHIPSSVKWIDITLHPRSTFQLPQFPLTERINFFLPLHEPYEICRSRYRDNHLRNIQRAEKAGCIIDREIDPATVIELAKQYLSPRGYFPHTQLAAFVKLLRNWIAAGEACCYAIRLRDKVLASAVFLTFQDRAYYLLVGNHPDGKTLGASHALIDGFIKDHAGGNWVLDFEGSDIPSLAFFYEGFGSAKETFGWLRVNRLPRWIAWLKK